MAMCLLICKNSSFSFVIETVNAIFNNLLLVTKSADILTKPKTKPFLLAKKRGLSVQLLSLLLKLLRNAVFSLESSGCSNDECLLSCTQLVVKFLQYSGNLVVDAIEELSEFQRCVEGHLLTSKNSLLCQEVYMEAGHISG